MTLTYTCLLSLVVMGKKFIFNTFRMLLDFLSAIYNGEKSLKEAEISQRNLEKKIEELKFNYRPENAEEKEEVNVVLMQANDLLEYRNKIIDAFKDGTFLSEYLKKSDDTGYKYELKDVKKITQEIKSMSEKNNLSLFEEFFESSSPANYSKMLINTSSDENKRQNIKFKRKNKKMTKTEKKKIKMLMRH